MSSLHSGVSVLVTTYNSPRTLECVLLALAGQSTAPDRVVVADDGSGPETADTIARVAGNLPFPLIHVWQPDEGFRLARSRNNGLREIDGGLVAILDQDMLPDREWLGTHASNVPQGCVGIGNSVDVPESLASRVAPGDPLSVLFDAGRESGEFRRLRRLQRKSGFYGVLRRIGLGIKTKPSLRGNNMSAHVPDLRSVNGFDEEYVGWGQEDDDLGRRLYRLGVRPVVLVSRALAVHLGHGVRKTGSWQDGPNVARFHRRDLPARCAMGMDGKRPDVVVRRYPGRVG